jgi:outer membrane protein assembly factor BamB/tetratricopeptide (TPR) repeat protein
MFSPRQVRQGWALLSAAAVSAVCVAVAVLPVVAADPPAPPLQTRPDPGTAANAAGASGNPAGQLDHAIAEARRRQVLNEYLVRDREYSVLLESAAQALREGRHIVALRQFQELLDAPQDVFVWTDSGVAPRSARTAAMDLMRGMPVSARDDYERLYGADARRLWEDFRSGGDYSRYAELLRRYQLTESGAEALQWGAESALDYGRFGEAARCWSSWFEDHPSIGHRGGSRRIMAEVAARLAAADGMTVSLPEADWTAPVTMGDQTRTGADWVEWWASVIQRPSVTRESTSTAEVRQTNIVGGEADAGAVPTATPLWTSVFADELDRAAPGIEQVGHLETGRAAALVAERWRRSRAEQRLPCAGANQAVVHDGIVLVRDYCALTARALDSGRVLWRLPLVSAVLNQIGELPEATTSGTNDPQSAAAQVFEDEFASNSVLGRMTCDGRHVYVIDASDSAHAMADTEAAPVGPRNRLLAVTLGGEGWEGGQVTWTFPAEEEKDEGWYLLGAPTPGREVLFALAERNCEVHLLALERESGAVRWDQPVSIVDRGIDEDANRRRVGCQAVIADGVVVCPTQLGTLVGVDAISGRLLWMYAFADPDGPSQPWRSARATEKCHGRLEFAGPPVIAHGRIIAFGLNDPDVHCVELATGRSCWKRPRFEAQYAEVAADGMLLLVGLRECMGLRLEDGSIAWRTRTEPPAGRGTACGERYLLPGVHGRVQVLNLQTGELAPDLLPPPSTHTALRVTEVTPAAAGDVRLEAEPVQGNLTVHEDYVVSCGPEGIVVRPRADAALRMLKHKIGSGIADADDYFRMAELELRLGRVDQARSDLQTALERHPDDVLRGAIERHLREILYAVAADGTDRDALDQLDRLAQGADERARFLALQLRLQLEEGRPEDALQTAAALLQLEIVHAVPMDARGRHCVRPERLAAAAMARARDAVMFSDGLAAPSLLATAPPAELRQLIDLCRSTEEASRLRCELAQLLIERGAIQEAELLLVAECAEARGHAAIEAAGLLACLWESCGLARDARMLLEETARRWDVPTSDPTGLPDGPAMATVDANDVRIEAVCESADRAADTSPADTGEWAALFQRNREFYRQAGGSLALFDRGTQGAAEKSSLLSIVNVAARRGVLDLNLKPRVWRMGDTSRSDAGHFLPVACGEIHGISLLEGRLLWTVAAPLNATGDKPILGPYGPECCVVQAGETVVGLDPRDGGTLWTRSDFDADAGLVSDEVSGMYGDQRALVVFDADHVHYRVLDPRSGDLLRSGELPVTAEDLRKRRWCFGRKLLYTSSAAGEPRLKLWDALLDQCDLDMPLSRRLLIDASAGGRQAAILNGERLMIVDTDTGGTVWEREFAAGDLDGTRMLRVVHDLDRFYIHLERDSTGSPFSPATGDLEVPNLQLGGMLCVVDRNSGACWSRTMPRCNLLWFPSERLPVLITLARTRDGQSSQNVSLAMQVLDVVTGETLAARDGLQKGTVVHADCGAAGRVELAGAGFQFVVWYGDE